MDLSVDTLHLEYRVISIVFHVVMEGTITFKYIILMTDCSLKRSKERFPCLEKLP